MPFYFALKTLPVNPEGKMAIHFSSVSQLKSIFFISVRLGSPKTNFSFIQKKVFHSTLPQKLSIKCIISLHHHHHHPPTHSNLFMLCSHSFTCIIIAVILYHSNNSLSNSILHPQNKNFSF